MNRKQTEKLLQIVVEELESEGAKDLDHIMTSPDKYEDLIQKLAPRLCFYGFSKRKDGNGND